MNTFIFWTEMILIFGGILVCMVGLIWDKTAQLLLYFGKAVNPNVGVRIILMGFLMLLSGLGFIYFRK